MKASVTALIAGAALVLTLPSYAQAPRHDAIWARSTAGAPITLDGVLSEPAWAAAESKVIQFRHDSGIPGGGWQFEGGKIPRDSTVATLKFLVDGNQLYMAAVVKDSSIGGSVDFNRFDGFLMALKDRAAGGHPAPPSEYLYSWWFPEDSAHAQDSGRLPGFGGRWANWPWGSARTQEQIDNWDARTVVTGLTNTDATVDVGYTVEMRFNLAVMGYDVTQAEGDIVEWNISIYDTDWYWPLNGARFSANRVWWQSPWGNAMWYDEVQIFARPTVTISSGPVSPVEPEVHVRNGALFPSPTIDGLLTEPVWAAAPRFDIRYGDDALRETYGNPLKWRAGQYQPPVNSGLAPVDDPGDATVRWFFKADSLYLGFDVRDISVTSIPVVDRWDGFIVSINDRLIRYQDNNLESRRLAFRVGPTGAAEPEDWTDSLLAMPQGGKLALALKPGTTVDTTGADEDAGYTAEFRINLRKLGYPAGRGDGTLFIGIDYFDGDCFPFFQDSYGTRTWWGREYQHQCCPVWAYMNPMLLVNTDVGDPAAHSARFHLLGNYPNPFWESTSIRFMMAEPSVATLEVYDLQGRRVASRALGRLSPGVHNAPFERSGLRPGIYTYRVKLTDPSSGTLNANLAGKMLFLE